ncbi:hypothetical protein TNCV_68271 [Trichonephila clavipes]|nr:hypothetical protein TNCV_68271 [Trichonephila clavipes]
MPPNTPRVYTEYMLDKISGSESFVGGCSRNHKCRELKNIPPPSSSMPKLWRWRSVVSPSIVKEIQPVSQALATFIPSLREFHRAKSYLYGARG